ncbi:MAG: fused MFS/spermidine synthase [Planctomycetota bacterium]
MKAFGERGRSFPVLWLAATALVCGGVVMVVELLGARMLSVGYGASLFVWAAMISVTLTSLAVGYFAGGALADRVPRPSVLYGIVMGAGLLLVACPHTRPVLKACYARWGLRYGALASSVVVFFLPLGLLGMVSPFVIRLVSERGKGIGLTAGGIYALSTVGSVAGTLLAGLYLIPELGTTMGFRIAALTGGVVALVGLVLALGLRGAVAAVVPVAVALVPGPDVGAGYSYTAPDGEPVTVKAVEDSAHGHIVVLEKGHYHLLVVNGIVQTGIFKDISHLAPAQLLKDHYFLELLPYAYDDPREAKGLLIGLAGGLIATVLRQHGMEVESVELDPALIRIARESFWFRGPAVAADGRRFLEDCTERYDFCIIDTYSGDTFPFHLTSLEAFQAARDVLADDGILAVNFIGSPTGLAFASAYHTVGQVFPHVRAIQSEAGDSVQPIVIFASAEPIQFNRGWLGELGVFDGVDPISAAIARLTVEPDTTDALLLTDDHNPIDLIRSDEALRWRRRTIQELGDPLWF